MGIDIIRLLNGPKGVFLSALVPVCLLILVIPSWAEKVASAERNACLSATGPSAVALCSEALSKDAGDADVRLALGEAYMELGRYQQAVSVFKIGVEVSPANRQMKTDLSRAEQLLEEKRWIEAREQKRERAAVVGKTSQQRIAASRYEIRCTKLSGSAALKACDEGLREFPGHAVLYRGRGDALMDLKRYGEALEAYRDAQVLNPSDALTGSGIVKARTQRKVSAQKCLQLNGPVALDACRSALLKGEKDESAILQRQGDLFKSMGNSKDAVASYQAALAIDGRNTTVLGKLEAMGVIPPIEQPPAGIQPVAVAQPVPKASPKTDIPAKPVKTEPRAEPKPKPSTRVDQPGPLAPDQSPAKALEKTTRDRPEAAPAIPPKKPEPLVEAGPKFTNAPLPDGFTY